MIPYERKAFYYETDQMGIVHHSNYIRWLEEARIDFLSQIGVEYKEMEEAGILIPVLSVSCNYKKPVLYNETICIDVKLIEFNGVTFTMEYDIVNKETVEKRAIGSSSHCFVDREMKPLRLKRVNETLYETLRGLTKSSK